MMVNLLDLDLEKMIVFFRQIGEKDFRAKQVMKWLHKSFIDDISLMSDLSKDLRIKLKDNTFINYLPILIENKSNDGTIKWLLGIDDNNAIETVFIPEEQRGTLCISSQIGCALDCSFCSTGKQGFNRNLTTSEIIGQLWLANKRLGKSLHNDRIISNVVMMGMGEPLANLKNVIPALKIMLDDYAYGLSRRRVTVSTSGLIPQIETLAQETPVSLAISLHASNDELRNILIPINKKYPLKDLIKTCKNYLSYSPRDFITMEYVMINEVNDSISNAYELIDAIDGLSCKFNLIPFNPFTNSNYQASSSQRINKFRNILQNAGFIVTVRKTRGDDIDAACGQLAGKVKDKTNRTKNKTWDIVQARG